MKKKLLICLLTICCVLSLSFGLVACVEEPGCDHELLVTTQSTESTQGVGICSKCQQTIVNFPTLNDTDYTVDATNPDYITYTYTYEGETVTFAKSNFVFEVSKGGGDFSAIISAYNGNSSSVVIPATMITEMGNVVASVSFLEIATEVFKDKTTITSITLPEGLRKIGDYAFANTGITEFTIPNSVTRIGVGLVAGCNLQKIYTPYAGPVGTREGNSNVEETKFCNLFGNTNSASDVPTSLKEVFVTRDGIANGAFVYCENIEKVTMTGEHANGVASSAFECCTSLEEVILSSNVETIGSSAFRGCPSLTKLIIPVSVKNIMPYAFENSENLETIYYMGTKQQWDNINIVNSDNGNDVVLNATKYYYYENQPTAIDYLNNNRQMNMWHYDNENNIEMWELNFTTSLDGKYYGYSHSEVSVSDEYWAMLQEAKSQGILEMLFDNDAVQVEMVTSSATKAEYEGKFANWYATLATTATLISFADSKITLTLNGQSTQTEYIEVDFVAYFTTTKKLAFTINQTDNTIFEELVTDYYTVRHVYAEAQ